MLDPEDLISSAVVEVPIEKLLAADSPRHDGESLEHVRRMAQSEDRLPPIVVNRSTMKVIDGMHRLSAARLRGAQTVDVRFFEGDDASAFVLAVRANVTHGLPLSLADRKSAAQRILEYYPQWSNRAIAVVTGLAANTVAQVRKSPTAQNEQLDTRRGWDGRMRPVNSAERRAAAARLMSEEPDASLRDIARRAGISPETVRKLRARQNGAPSAAEAAGLASDQARPGERPRASAAESGLRRPDQGCLVSSLSADPAVRSSELGRTLLRALTASLLLDDRWEQLAEMLPDYRLGNVALAAQACAAAWQRFGQRIEERHITNEASG